MLADCFFVNFIKDYFGNASLSVYIIAGIIKYLKKLEIEKLIS